MNARERAKAALEAWESLWGNHPMGGAGVDVAQALRDLLAATALTEEEREIVESFRRQRGQSGSMSQSYDDVHVLAIIDRFCPPEHEPCPFCGGAPVFDPEGGVECSMCRAQGPVLAPEKAAWIAWDRRAGGGA